MKRIAIVGLVGALVCLGVGCKERSVNGSSSAPPGVHQGYWDDYCERRPFIVGAYRGALSNPTIPPAVFLPTLTTNQQVFETYAAGTSGPVSAQFHKIAVALGRAKVAAEAGKVPVYNDIVVALAALPSCQPAAT